MSTQPTDAEIDEFLDSPGNINWVLADKRERFRLFTRAVLAKWGTPTPVGVEPVARLEIGKTKGGVSLTHIAEPAAFQLPEGMYALYTAEALAIGREPLSDEQIHAIYDEVARKEPYAGAVTRRSIVRAIEAAHGIKGGQHGTDT